MNPYIIKKPVITEKSLMMANQQNVYTFSVDPLANKDQIAAAIEKLYEVSVVSVNTTVKKPVITRTGRKRQQKMTTVEKKAFVTLKDGDIIELFDLTEK